MSCEEWKNAKSESQSITAGVQRAKEYKQAFINEYKNPKGLGDGSDVFGIMASHALLKHIDIIDFDNPDAIKSVLKELRGCDEMYTYIATRENKTIDPYPEDWMNEYNFQHGKVVMRAERYGYGYVRVQND